MASELSRENSRTSSSAVGHSSGSRGRFRKTSAAAATSRWRSRRSFFTTPSSIFQTAAVRLLLPRARWRRFADFSYVHHTIREGDVRWGGLETGYADAGAAATLQAYLDAWHAGERLEGSSRVAACDVQLTAGDGDFKRVSYVPHGKTRWGWLAAPYCNKNGRAPLW